MANHAVVIVGVSFNNSKGDYFIAKNSWGNDWGEDGYMRFNITGGNCVICNDAVIPVI
jgi:aminopeptidase C